MRLVKGYAGLFHLFHRIDMIIPARYNKGALRRIK